MPLVELLALGLVFVACVSVVWVISPLLVEAGMERTAGRYVDTEAAVYDPLYRFTTPERLMQSSWSAALLGGGLIGAILLGVGVTNPYGLVLAVLVVGFVGFRIPRAWVNRRIRQRNLTFQSRLVDLTLGLANGLRSGAALPQTLEIIARDVGGPVGEEFNLLLHEYHLGVDMIECFNRLCRRMPGEDLQLLTTAIRLTLQAGGSLAEVLDKISDMIRQRTEFRERLLTMTAQGRFEAIAMAAAPAVAFVVLYTIDPTLMRPLVTTSVGWAALGLAATLEVIGFFFINRIVSIEV